MSVLSTATLRGETGLLRGTRVAGNPHATRTDGDLMRAISRGDERALDELYSRFGSLAYGLALRILGDRELAEDAVQEAFLSVWRSAPRFDGRRGHARNWVLMLVHRRAVDLVQHNQRERDHAQDHAPERLEPSAADTTELNEDRRDVQVALAALPAKQRTALDLAYYAGYTQQEIATCLHVPIGTVKSQTFEGLRRLQQLLSAPRRQST